MELGLASETLQMAAQTHQAFGMGMESVEDNSQTPAAQCEEAPESTHPERMVQEGMTKKPDVDLQTQVDQCYGRMRPKQKTIL